MACQKKKKKGRPVKNRQEEEEEMKVGKKKRHYRFEKRSPLARCNKEKKKKIQSASLLSTTKAILQSIIIDVKAWPEYPWSEFVVRSQKRISTIKRSIDNESKKGKKRRAKARNPSLLPNPIQLPPPPIQPPPPLPQLIRVLVIAFLQFLAHPSQTLNNTKDKRFVFKAQYAAVGIEKSVHSNCRGVLQRRTRRDERTEERLRAAGLACAVVGNRV